MSLLGLDSYFFRKKESRLLKKIYSIQFLKFPIFLGFSSPEMFIASAPDPQIKLLSSKSLMHMVDLDASFISIRDIKLDDKIICRKLIDAY